MACLYAAVGHAPTWVRERESWRTVIKYGVTKFDHPWNRLNTHATSRDTPWSAPIDMDPILWVNFDRVWEARSAETEMKRFARNTYLPSIALGPGSAPSGEWLLHPHDPWSAAVTGDFFDFALASLDGASRSPFCRATYAAVADARHRAAAGDVDCREVAVAA